MISGRPGAGAPASPRAATAAAAGGDREPLTETKGQDENPEDGEGQAPAKALRGQRGEGLHQQRIGRKRKQAAEIAGGIEGIGIPGLRAVAIGPDPPCEPGLQQRGGRGQEGEGYPERQHEFGKQPEDRMARIRITGQSVDREGHGQGSNGEERQMHQHLPAHVIDALQQMCTGVSREQGPLEERQGRVPDRRRSTEKGQQHPRGHRLDQKYEARAQEHGDGVKARSCQGPATDGGCRGRRNIADRHGQ